MCEISVVVPGYNTPEEDWNRCVRSILSLIGRTDEVICVDDCSLTRPKCLEVLAKDGTFVAKIFQGGTEQSLLAQMKQRFKTVKHAKPPASRKESPEFYVVASGFKG